MPPPVHRLQVESVRDAKTAAGADRRRLVRVGWRGGRRVRRLQRLELGDVVLEGGVRPAELGGRPAHLGGAGAGDHRRPVGPTDVRGARGLVVVVVGGRAAGTAAAGDARVHVTHGRVARGEVRREVAGWVVRRA